MEKAQLKTILMSPNGSPLKPVPQFPWKEIIVSIASTLIIAYGAVLWSINTIVTRVQEQQLEDIKYKEQDQVFKNQLQLDIRDIREKLIRNEKTQNQQKSPL